MNPKAVKTEIHVITGIPDLSLAEQAALAFIHAHPGCSNRALASRVGISKRGAEEMVARFRKRGLVRQDGVGRGRRLELTFAVDDPTRSGKTEIPKSHIGCGRAPSGGLAKAQHSHTECANAPSGGLARAPKRVPGEAPGRALTEGELPFDQFVDFHFDQFQICLGRGELAGALEHLEVLRERLEELDAHMPDDMARAEISRALKVVMLEENRVKGFMWVASHYQRMTREDARLITTKVKQADETQLARLTVYLQSNPAVGDAAAVLALLGGAR